jgi:hypothetical protein
MADNGSLRLTDLVALERLACVLGGSERELPHPLEHNDNEPLARSPELLDMLAVLEARGLIVSEPQFRLLPAGRALLAEVERPPAQ